MDMRLSLAGLLAGALVVAGCGDDQEPQRAADTAAEPSAAYASPLTTEDGELLVSCGGGVGFPASVLADGVTDALTRAEAEAIFTDLLADPQLTEELSMSFLADGVERTRWRVLRDDGDSYVLGLGSWSADGPGKDASVMYVERHDSGWQFTGGGTCTLEPLLAGENTWVRLTLPAAGLDRTSTSPTVGVTEQECSSGRDPRPFLHDPVVVETSTSVTVYWTSTPVDGAATCLGPAPTEVTLPLDQPLGDRALLDGSTYPPAPIPASLFG